MDWSGPRGFRVLLPNTRILQAIRRPRCRIDHFGDCSAYVRLVDMGDLKYEVAPSECHWCNLAVLDSLHGYPSSDLGELLLSYYLLVFGEPRVR